MSPYMYTVENSPKTVSSKFCPDGSVVLKLEQIISGA